MVFIHLFRITLYHFHINMTYIHLIMFGIFILVMIVEIPIIYLCVKYLPYMFAQKDLIRQIN